MQQQDAVDRIILQRQFALVGKRNQILLSDWPRQNPLACRHQREHAFRLAEEGPQIGCGEAEPEHPHSGNIRPYLPYARAQLSARYLTQTRLIKVAQIDHVDEHGLSVA